MQKNNNLFLRDFSIVALGYTLATLLLIQMGDSANKRMKSNDNDDGLNTDTCVVDCVMDGIVDNKRMVFCRKMERFVPKYKVITSDKDLFNGWDTNVKDTIVIENFPTGKCAAWHNISRMHRNQCR